MADIDKLLTMLASPKADTRYSACEELRVAPAITPQALEALQNAMNDPDPYVIESAKSALKVHSLPQVDPSLAANLTGITSSTQEPQREIGKRFGIRAGSYVIDYLALLAFTALISFMAEFFIRIALAIVGRPHVILPAPFWRSFLIALFLEIIYFTCFEWLYGASPGKLILKMRVIKKDGGRVNLRSAFIRAILRWIDLLFWGLVAYSQMKPPYFQRVGDNAAKTIVVDSHDPLIQESRPGYWWLIAASIFILASALLHGLQLILQIRYTY